MTHPANFESVTCGRARGWLHRPSADASFHRLPVLVLGPMGSEDLCARRSVVDLAQRLSNHGHAVLRLDLPGTSDAAGSLLDTGLWAEWQTTVSTAIDRLCADEGHHAVCLVGLRLGALVALEAAYHRGPQPPWASHLVLLAPVLNGRQHLRELKTLSAEPPTNGEPALVVAGVPWGHDLVAHLTDVDMTLRPPPTGLEHVWVGLAHENKAWRQWLAQWEPVVPVGVCPYGDLDAHLGNQLFSQTPEPLWSQVVDWLGSIPHRPVEAGATTRPARSADRGAGLPTLATAEWVETGRVLDAGFPVAAVLCEPHHPGDPSAPLVLLCNTGRNPHTGWARSWVELARLLAQQGLSSLRFDLPGIGDSPPLPNPPDEILYSDTQLPLMAALMQRVRELGSGERPLVMVGVCSGGYLAFHHATVDPLVRGVVLVNVQKWVWTPGTSLEVASRSLNTHSTQTYARKALSAETWVRLMKGDINWRPIAQKFTTVFRSRVAHLSLAVWQSATPRRRMANPAPTPHQKVTEGFEQLSRRGTAVSVVFSEDDAGRDEFALYFGATAKRFKQLPHTRWRLIPGADHVLTAPDARQRLYDCVLETCQAVTPASTQSVHQNH